jgi:hypothetical protein
MEKYTQSDYTYPDLVKRFYDLRHLAVPPAPGEKSGSFSSYDRRSVYNDQTGCYENWGANNDGDGFISQEGDSILALELDGPGVIWRVWSAYPGEGHIRIFIDDGDKPVVDRPFRDFFEKFGDERCPANFPDLLPILSRGRNSYIPIPFQRHCKVLLDKDWGNYYHITYALLPSDANIPSFDGSFNRESSIALAEADRILHMRGRSPYLQHERGGIQTITESVPPGRSAVLCDKNGSGAIAMIKARVDGIERESEEDQRRILRELTLSIKWDQEQTSSVWSPLGDFFGSAPGINEYRSLPLGMNVGSFYSYWYMPFSEGALLEIGNDGDQTRKVTFEIEFVPMPKTETDVLMRFHSKWHRGDFLHLERNRFEEGGDRWPDWPLLLVKGKGRFCGVHLHVFNAWKTPLEQAETWWYGRWDRKTIDWWWGEGDEKFFVDGESFPSTFGTGSEDYIGYAWAAEPPFPMFDSAFACQPFIEIDANGHTSVNRFHIADNVPFSQSFQGFIEKYKDDVWEQYNKCLFAATVYWYQMPGTGDLYEPIPVKERYGFYTL